MSYAPTLTAHARDILNETDATDRAARVPEAHYALSLDLAAGRPTYRGDLTLRFAARGAGSMFLDFRGKTVELLDINGTSITPDWNGFRLTLPGDALGSDNTVRIVYENDYDTTGDGFHRFVDPEDGEEYVYTNFEPYEAHRLFPCFDQPDIKGRYLVDVTAPSAWQVVANAPLEAETPASDDRTRHQFAESELFSTYLMALVGGPYVSRRITHNGLELGLYARRSMERYLNDQAPEIFEVTTQGLDFYAEMFEQPYPFAKYDQVFVPEYNSGAMENVGCVTYNEAYLFRDPATESQKLDRAETFLHELAHMWFGNLVTMRWWNDLWLNESFATYISYVAMTEATRFTNAWKVFNADIKRWAYQQDQLPTTHPIAGTAADTEIAFLNFDGITYGKGASVLKQLAKYIGRDAFRDGLRLYFRRHGWSNATLADFLSSLQEKTSNDLEAWARLWLSTASLNTLSTEWQSDGSQVSALAIQQTAPDEYPTLRPHALEVALARNGTGKLKIESLAAWIDGPDTPIAEARGREIPDFVFPNYGDYAYAKVSLDEKSVDFIRHHLDKVDDALLRQLLWMSLWEMVRDRELSSIEYLAIGRSELPDEPDHDILNSILDRTGLLMSRYVPESMREAEAHQWYQVALAQVARSTGDKQLLWARSAIGVAATTDDVQQLARLATGAESLAGFELDQEMRWAVATKALAFDLPEADDMLETESARDRSDRGKRALLRAEAARPTAEAKEEAWNRIHGDGYGSFHLTRAAMLGFWWPHQHELLEPYADRFFDRIEEVFDTRDHPFARAYLVALYPAYRAAPEVLARSRRMLDELDGSMPTLSRQLAESADDLDRQIKVREFAETGSNTPVGG
ncbi:MAG TPA: aminopeptidase N [Candidatus Limnocylindrales bacterium]|nr:aminopeptidase N [Candidatus Limnocylindrales bacterium]